MSVSFTSYAPTLTPFSNTTTRTSFPFSFSSCLRRIAALSPAGPAPTMQTSTSSKARSIFSRWNALCRQSRTDLWNRDRNKELELSICFAAVSLPMRPYIFIVGLGFLVVTWRMQINSSHVFGGREGPSPLASFLNTMVRCAKLMNTAVGMELKMGMRAHVAHWPFPLCEWLTETMSKLCNSMAVSIEN